LVPETSVISQKDLQAAEYLSAMINETLRLHPPVPSTILRLTPPDGLTVGDVHIPGNITIGLPSYSIGRCKY
jgi:cytochrome P450